MMKLTKADKILIVLLLLVAVGGIGTSLFMFQPTGDKTAQVWVDGKIVKTIAMRPGYHEEYRYGGNEHYDIIEVDNGRVRVREADCPDQDCVRTGWISAAPQQIVCLPYKLAVRIVSTQASDIDDIAR